MLGKFKHYSKTVASSVASKKPGGKKEENYLVALDIGTEFVKALIAVVNDDNTVNIIGVGRTHQSLQDMQAGAISDIASVVSNCDDALNQAEQQAGVSARTAVLGIAGELVKGTTTTVRCSRKNPNKPLEIAEIEQIVGLVQERAEQKAKQQLAWELGGKSVEIRLVNSALVSIDIDGYYVTNPIGFQGKEVLVQLYTAFAPLIHIGALERAAQELDLDLLAVAAEPFAVARSVIGDDPNAFTKGIERDLDINFEDAEKLKMGLSVGSVPPQIIKNVQASIDKTTDVWESGIELALGEFNKLDHLPNLMLLCGGGSSLDSLMDRLETTDWYRELPFTKKPKVQHIHPNQVVGITDSTGQVNDHTYITAMGLLRVGVDTMFQQTSEDAGNVRQKLDRMLRK
jgi:cell division protein FtsA